MRELSLSCLGLHGFHRVNYYEWGKADNPKVLICVHGLTRNGRDFDDLARALSSEYRVLCPDVAGRGKSEWADSIKQTKQNVTHSEKDIFNDTNGYRKEC